MGNRNAAKSEDNMPHIIIDHPLDFDGKDHISINDDNAINFVGEEMDIGDYMAKKYDQDEDIDMEMSL